MLPGVGLTEFVAPGIVLYAVAYTAFQNSAAMIVMDKMECVIADVQMAPVSPLELVVGFVLSAASCGLPSGALVPVGPAFLQSEASWVWKGCVSTCTILVFP